MALQRENPGTDGFSRRKKKYATNGFSRWREQHITVK
jgi:hypothetical protein